MHLQLSIMSSLSLGKCHKKVSKSFAKFTRAVRKTPRRIADLLGSTLSPSHNRSITDTTYASINSLNCPCSYHFGKRQDLGLMVPNLGGEVKNEMPLLDLDQMVIIESQSESESAGDETSETSAIERRMDESGMECSSPFEVNERAERFIESQRKSFKDDQKLHRQRSVHDH